MNQVGIDPNINKWNDLVALGVIDPHDSLSHPAGGSDTQAETASCLDSDHYTDFVVGALSNGTFSGEYHPWFPHCLYDSDLLVFVN